MSENNLKSTKANKHIRWGVIGCGIIAQRFATSIKCVDSATIVACASQTQGKAKSFADKNAIANAHDSYADLLERSDIDVVYIATTHNFHYENVKQALAAGKAVLCEKPITVNEKEAQQLVEQAQKERVFLMEAMWTRFLPAIGQVKQWLKEGHLGDIRQVKAEFGFEAPYDPKARLFNRDLAGGALLDAGIYPVSFASFVLEQQPKQIQALASIGSTGVDEQSMYLFDYGKGCLASLGSTCRTDLDNRAEIIGVQGKIVIPSGFLWAEDVELHFFDGREPIKKSFPFAIEEGFQYQIQAVCENLRNNELQNAIMPLQESIDIMHTMDRIRGELNITYPNDKAC